VTFFITCGTLSVIQWRSCDARKGGYNDGLRIFACRFALEGFPVPRNTNALKAENRPLWECTPIIRMRQVRPSLKGEMRLFNQFAHRHWVSAASWGASSATDPSTYPHLERSLAPLLFPAKIRRPVVARILTRTKTPRSLTEYFSLGSFRQRIVLDDFQKDVPRLFFWRPG